MTKMVSVHRNLLTKYHAIKMINGNEDYFVKSYLLKNYIECESLNEKNRKRLEFCQHFKVDVARKLLTVLQYVHKKKLAHKSLEPSSVILYKDKL